MKPELQKRVKSIKLYRGISNALLYIAGIAVIFSIALDVITLESSSEKFELSFLEVTPIAIVIHVILYVGVVTNIISSSMSSSLFIDMVEETD